MPTAIVRLLRPGIVFPILIALWAGFSFLLLPHLSGARPADPIPPTSSTTAAQDADRAYVPAPAWGGTGERLSPLSVFRRGAALLFVVWLLFLFVPAVLRPGYYERFVGPATPAALGYCRIGAFALLTVFTVSFDLPATRFLPDEMRERVALLRPLYLLPIDFETLRRDAVFLTWVKWCTAGAAAAAALGLFSRLSVPLATLGSLLVGGLYREYASGLHTYSGPLHLAIALCFMPCADGLSLDRLIRKARGRPVVDDAPAPVYGWCRYICWMLIAAAYVQAGWWKVYDGGPLWWHPDNVRYHAYFGTLNPNTTSYEFGLLLRYVPDWCLGILGLAALLGESLFLLVLFFRQARWVFPPLMTAMHLGIRFFQNVPFPDLELIQVLFITRRPKAAAGADAGAAANPSVPVHSAAADADTPTRAVETGAPVWPWVTAALATVLLLFWWLRVEMFPLTTWRLYSGANTSGIVAYMRLYGRLPDGSLVRVRLEDYLPALVENAYYRITVQALSRVPKPAFALFAAALERAPHRPNAAPIVGLELQHWVWNYRDDPTGPPFGRMVRAVRYPPPPG